MLNPLRDDYREPCQIIDNKLYPKAEHIRDCKYTKGSTENLYIYSMYNSTRLIKPNPQPTLTLR